MSNKPASIEEIALHCRNPELMSYVVLAMRVGVMGFLTQMEYTYYKPDTDKNDQFTLAFMKWPLDATMHWVIMSIPILDAPKADALLWQHGLKAAAPGFIHMVIDHKGQHEIPIQGPNVRYLENHGQNVMYSNDPVKMKAAREHENEWIEKIHADHRTWLNTPEGRAEAEAYWKKHNISGKDVPYNPNRTVGF